MARTAALPVPRQSYAAAWWRTNATALLFMAPAAILIAVFFLAPVVITFAMSFTDLETSTGLSNWTWIGPGNYQRMFRSGFTFTILGNTLMYVGVTLAFNVLVGRGVAAVRDAQLPRQAVRARGALLAPDGPVADHHPRQRIRRRVIRDARLHQRHHRDTRGPLPRGAGRRSVGLADRPPHHAAAHQVADPVRADLPDDEPVRVVRVHPPDDERRSRSVRDGGVEPLGVPHGALELLRQPRVRVRRRHGRGARADGPGHQHRPTARVPFRPTGRGAQGRGVI